MDTKQIRNKSLNEFVKDTANDQDSTQGATNWQGWRAAFYTGFWHVFGQKLSGGVTKLDSVQCGDVLDICDQIKGVNRLVDSYLRETYPQAMTQDAQKLRAS